ncbi:AdoMet_MTases domain containing protein [uncultured Caudovirales phage]|uniref:AdoMet_MTases domain containing protein n=1 Tax=uncultured Caudovirales phage TaxID=2100421 RepID=A0A6J7XN05_9CAUD|nr:AdoMet_MTases domain containing protein [uncultured Caudovirales phage]CAB5229350.1 AdoMet_MTases domain containing protein [uncultured Caudovirales phage]
MTHPKSFYHNYQANNNLFEIDRLLINEVLSVSPQTILDFGTGTGKNIKFIHDLKPSIVVCGLDMSFLNIIHARAKNELPFLIIGDESHLCRLTNFDVIMTCSVLCHIENINEIVKEFKRIVNYSIFIAETNNIAGEFYYPHDYESFGFKKTNKSWHSAANNSTYNIYQWNKLKQ